MISLPQRVLCTCCPALCLLLYHDKISTWCLSQKTGLLFSPVSFNDWVFLWSQIQRAVSPRKLIFHTTQCTRMRTEAEVPSLCHLLTQRVQRPKTLSTPTCWSCSWSASFQDALTDYFSCKSVCWKKYFYIFFGLLIWTVNCRRDDTGWENAHSNISLTPYGGKKALHSQRFWCIYNFEW